jgi:hypothetical protein
MSVEKLGVPTAPIIWVKFKEVVKGVAYVKGMPNLRFTFIPQAVAGRPAMECRKYLEGDDPITGKPIVEQALEALTKPLSNNDRKTGFIERPRERLVKPDTPENLQRLFLENGWTDYLPIVLPTKERVAEMLKGTSHSPDEVVGKMRPSSPHEAWSYTVEKVAVNAVMAGAKPEHFSVILAIASTGVTSLFTSTTSFARMVVINGPIRNEINMNAGLGAMSPFNEANAVIGRAWTLISKNLGNGGVPGKNYMGSQGNNLNYNNLCIPENEEALPSGWNPLHVQKGFKPEESVVSIFSGHFIIKLWRHFPYHEAYNLAIRSFMNYGPRHTIAATVLLDPLVAMVLKKDEGFNTKEEFTQWLEKNVLESPWEYWRLHPEDLKAAKEGVEPFASWLKLPYAGVVPVPRFSERSASPIHAIIVGGGTNAFCDAGNFNYIASTSVDKWR